MEIQEKKIEELKEYKRNPRKNKEAIDLVANSIKEFGFKVPIVIDKNNEIVAGHTRFLASKKLKLKKVPCIIASDLNEEQIKAFRLADNKTAEFSEWDDALLVKELKAIEEIDMQEFGFIPEEDDKVEIVKKELEPYQTAHYLISVEINKHDEIINKIKQLEKIEGVEIESSLN